jgi:predicted peroxiredoxin
MFDDWYSDEEELTTEELIAKEQLKEVEELYEYIQECKDTGVFSIFDKLTFEELFEFLTKEPLIKS